MKLTVTQLARMMDLSAVRTDVTLEEVKQLAEACKRYNVICAFVMPCYLPELKELLADAPDVRLGAVVGFPSGATSTASKVAEVKEQLAIGADEIDMVINVGRLQSGQDQAVEDDIRAVVEAAGDTPVKVILEVHYLTDEQIVRGCELCVKASAAFVKTGTGWAPTGATLDNVALMKQTVGERAEVKAAGGVRDLETVVEMIRRGVTRFGVGLKSATAILDECATYEDGIEI